MYRICLLLVHLNWHVAEFYVKVDAECVCALFLVDCDVDGLYWVNQLNTFRRVFVVTIVKSNLWMDRSHELLWHLDAVRVLELKKLVT